MLNPTLTPPPPGVPTAAPVSLDETRTLYDSIRRLIANSGDADRLREALVPALTYDLAKGCAETGALMHNPYADPKHPGMPGESSPAYLETTPFMKPSAGVSLPITYAAIDTGDVFVALSRKLKDQKHPELGLKEHYELIGGYMDAPPPGGGTMNRPVDHDLAQTARRELREETGIALPGNYQPRSLGLDSRHGFSNTLNEPTVNEYRHIQFSGPIRSLPQLGAYDDIAEAVWVNAKDLSYNPGVAPQPYDSPLSRYAATVADRTGTPHTRPLTDAQGEYLDKAVAIARQTLVRAHHQALGYVEPVAAIPSTNLGPAAHALHLEEIAGIDRLTGAPRPQVAMMQPQGMVAAMGRALSPTQH